MKVCLQCQSQFADADVFCPHDGTRLPDADLAPPDYGRLIGQLIDGRYQIEALLGEGGMGVVYKASHTLIEKPVAIKVLKADVAREESVVQRLLQEAKAASRIGHPNIVDVTDFGTLPDGSAYFVMEYIDGVTLARVIYDAAPMPMLRVLPIVAQIARALDAAHRKGVVHRDLKPDNIFVVERDGRPDIVKLVDFGIAKVAPVEGNLDGPRLTRAGSVFGTPEYMAPEQAAGRGDSDHRVDVYALGTIFYEMVVGQVPHKADSLVATLAMQMLDPIPLMRTVNPRVLVDPGIESVIMTALAKEREMRFQSMGDFLAALEGAVGALPVLLDPMASTGSMRALGGPRATPAVDLAGRSGGIVVNDIPTLREHGAPPAAPPLGPAGAPTQPDAPPAMPGPQTLRVAGPDDRTFAPDPGNLSPFRHMKTPPPGAPRGAAPGPPRGAPPPAAVAPTRAPVPTPPPGPPPPAPGPVPPRVVPAPELPTLKPVPSPAGNLAPPPTPHPVGPPAPRPLPPPSVPERIADPLPSDLRSVHVGMSTTARWAALALLLGASAVVAYLVLRPSGPAKTPGVAAGGAAPDAAPVAPADPDAGPAADAAVAVTGPAPGPADAGAGRVTPPPRGDVTIVLHTDPPGGTFTLGGRAVGIEGSRLTRPRGTRLELACQAPQHKVTTMTVVFDEKTRAVTCKLERTVRCNKELKNPFDPCPP